MQSVSNKESCIYRRKTTPKKPLGATSRLTLEISVGDEIAGTIRGDADPDDGPQKIVDVLAVVVGVGLRPAVPGRPVQVLVPGLPKNGGKRMENQTLLSEGQARKRGGPVQYHLALQVFFSSCLFTRYKYLLLCPSLSSTIFQIIPASVSPCRTPRA